MRVVRTLRFAFADWQPHAELPLNFVLPSYFLFSKNLFWLMRGLFLLQAHCKGLVGMIVHIGYSFLGMVGKRLDSGGSLRVELNLGHLKMVLEFSRPVDGVYSRY